VRGGKGVAKVYVTVSDVSIVTSITVCCGVVGANSYVAYGGGGATVYPYTSFSFSSEN
jgi:hypothetical protein